MLDFLTLQTTAAHATFITALYTMMVAFLLSSLIGLTYERTYRGLSYSRNYVQALILSSMVAAIVMQAIGDSLARGLGMIGALAIIRFRTVFKDPRDIIFMFASLAAGIACGVMAYTTGIVGTLGFCSVAFLLYYTPFGQARFYDGMLRFSIPSDSPDKSALETILNEYCRNFALITLRELAQGNKLDYAYHVKLKKGKSKSDFLIAVKKIESIEGVSLMLQETTVEV